MLKLIIEFNEILQQPIFFSGLVSPVKVFIQSTFYGMLWLETVLVWVPIEVNGVPMTQLTFISCVGLQMNDVKLKPAHHWRTFAPGAAVTHSKPRWWGRCQFSDCASSTDLFPTASARLIPAKSHLGIGHGRWSRKWFVSRRMSKRLSLTLMCGLLAMPSPLPIFGTSES